MEKQNLKQSQERHAEENPGKNLLEQIGGRAIFIRGDLPPGHYEKTRLSRTEPDGYVRKTGISLIFRPAAYSALIRHRIFLSVLFVILIVFLIDYFWKIGIIRF